ncbi:hypothetical protein AB0D13_27795 [Streptomyces sp. NPDC048430]|uniref:hypothetical protein n=1 Tax=unclassified Streptomyces TaxID=2593676 RepID=UPI00343BC0C5
MEWTDPRDMDDEEHAAYLREEKQAEEEAAHNLALTAWLDAQKQAFETWKRHREEWGPWDFTVDSLARLEAMVRAAYASPDRAREKAGEAEITVAAWYLGEVHNRAFGTGWRLTPGGSGLPKPRITPPWDRRDAFYFTDPEHIEEDARPVYTPTDVICSLPARPPERGLLHRIDTRWEVPTACDDPDCRYHRNG